MKLATVLTGALTAVLAACGGKPAGPTTPPPIGNTADPTTTQAPHEVLATLERGACFGSCPIYKVTIYRDGTVQWVGDQFVKVEGAALGTASPDDLATLEAVFAETHYLQLDDAYNDYDMTDMPSAKTSYSTGGRTKSIDHYYGDSDAPKVLDTVEEAIDTAAHTEQWVGTEAERDAMRNHRP